MKLREESNENTVTQRRVEPQHPGDGLRPRPGAGAGLGHDFLRHIERTKILLHIVDAASTEGRDPIEDIETINNELKQYNAVLADRVQILALNKTDAIVPGYSGCETISPEEDPIQRIRDVYEPQGFEIFEISAVTGKGIKELLYHIADILGQMDEKPVVFEREMEISRASLDMREPYTVSYDEKADQYVIEGPRIEKMLGYTNLDSEKGFLFFQDFLKEGGILDELEALGIQEGDTVRMYGHEFDYYRS